MSANILKSCHKGIEQCVCTYTNVSYKTAILLCCVKTTYCVYAEVCTYVSDYCKLT